MNNKSALETNVSSLGASSSIVELISPILANASPAILLVVKAFIALLLNYRSLGFSGIKPSDIPLETLTELEKLFSVNTQQELENTLAKWSNEINTSDSSEERAYKIGYLRGLKEGLTGLGEGDNRAEESADKPRLHKQ